MLAAFLKKPGKFLFPILFSVAPQCVFTIQANAHSVYKYVDQNGVITYTDKPKKNAKKIDLSDAIVEHIENQVILETIKHNGGDTLKIRNNLFAPVEIKLSLEQTQNVIGAKNKVIHWVLPPRSNIRLITLTPYKRNEPMHYQPKLSYTLGDPRALPKLYKYPLPWRGGPFSQSQGPGGKFSHTGPKGRYARDIIMPEGTPIIAARAGIVVKIERNQLGQGNNPSGNFIRILHNDGTMSVYLHLLPGSIRLREGDYIKVGQQIALSGNTGHSTGPHLHFVIQQNKGMSLESIPYEFTEPISSKH